MTPLCPAADWIAALNAQAVDRELARLRLESDLVALNTHVPLLTPWDPVPAIEHARLIGVTAQSLQRLDRAIRQTARILEIARPFDWPDRGAYGALTMESHRLAEFLRESLLSGRTSEGHRVGSAAIERMTEAMRRIHDRIQTIHIAVHDAESTHWRWMADHRIGAGR